MAVLLLIVAVALPLCSGRYVFNVSDSGHDTPACLQDHTIPCKTLEYVANHTNGLAKVNTLIEIAIESSQIQEPVVFENYPSGLQLTGNAASVDDSTCNCTRSGVGLSFVKVRNLNISDLTFEHCGMLQNSTSTNSTDETTLKVLNGIFIMNCTDVIVENVTVVNSNGTGIAFFDTDGSVTVSDSLFRENKVQQPTLYRGGGGVYIEFTICTPGVFACNHPTARNKNSSYTFHNCTFSGNNASTLPSFEAIFNTPFDNTFQGMARGGGLAIFIRSNASRNTFSISNCTFRDNSAIWGGGLFVEFLDFPEYNSVMITTSHFTNNTCYFSGGGGGGAEVGFLFPSNPQPGRNTARGNNITFMDCTFDSNNGKSYAGGVAVFASKGYHNAVLQNHIDFHNCLWIGNKATSSAAVHVSPDTWEHKGNGLLPIPVFTDCTFTSNEVEALMTYQARGVDQSIIGAGVFLVDTFTTKFQGRTSFSDNTGTAVYVTSGVLEFSNGTDATFRNNSGINGGAVALTGSSVIHVHENTTILFESNKATSKGGAIYVHSEPRRIFSHSCFIQYYPTNDSLDQNIFGKASNVTFNFSMNEASDDGQSIHTTSLYPCANACKSRITLDSIKSILACMGNFSFNNSQKRPAITTSVFNITLNSSTQLPITITPGKESYLPIIGYDELNQTIANVVYVALITNQSEHSRICIDPSYTSVPDKKIRLYGNPSSSGHLILEKSYTSISIEVTLTDCPPGFMLHVSRTGCFECVCAASKYFGITTCNVTSYRAHITHGFWVGSCGGDNKELCTAHCPIGFCSYDGSKMETHLLPGQTKALDSFICGPTRTGIVCGKCASNHSVYYHSWGYNCGENHLCHLGLLFYVLSELLPVTILFTVIMAFDISFTTGATNGFILFAQILDSLSFDGNGVIQFPTMLHYFLSVTQFIYRLFNLDFFSSFEGLSFCLWEGATTLNVLVMKYVTTAFALVLVLCTVLILKMWQCRKLCTCFRTRTLRSAVIHGLSAFFVMCYAQCVRVSVLILNPTCLQGENLHCVRKVVFRSGDLDAFHSEHLKYAIPAIAVLTFILIPPLLLVAYPLLFRLLALCGLSESRIVIKISRLVPIQLLDSFQSCFQDKLRFFAGLYFFYRFFALSAFAYSTTLTQFYIIVEVQSILILTLHAIARPYKKTWHNVVDALIFANIAIINGLTLFNFMKIIEGKEDDGEVQKVVEITSIVQFILTCLPIVYMATYTIGHIAALKKWKSNRSVIDDDNLPPLRGEEGSFDEREPLLPRSKIQAFMNLTD